ncbi:alanine--tRNA ligase [Candidatus Falkowbacteria bacterium]|jgi:alanyl-tRNA synthetase|nr:alanine--tRNA ligase [Candidatus Falkowbacteria bacterium]
MTSSEIRQKYLDFFAARGHAVISSASLIPENDPTVLFTTAGMHPLIPYLLGEAHPAGSRLVDSQKCFRADDIDEVGDKRHNTFFEMLGNWSFGDYFKTEQLTWWYQFLFEELGLDPQRVYQSVYAGSEDGKIEKDEESIKVLKELFAKYGITAEEGPTTFGKGEDGPGQEIDFSRMRIFPYRDKNWWMRGETIGEPGGPDSETFYDTGKPHDPKFGPHCHLNCDCGRFLEIGNSVFMQYKKTAAGWEELKNKNVDFGGGLERIAMVLQEKDSIFKGDLFSRIIAKIEELSGKKYEEDTRSFEVIADHIKAATFIVGDNKGVAPSNTDQGYIVRRLLRRAIRFGRQLGITQEAWVDKIAQVVVDDYALAYPELVKNKEFIFTEFKKEEEKFLRTLEKGLAEFKKIAVNGIDGVAAFNLYQSYGFPFEITEELAKENGITIDRAGFEAELKKHQALSRTAAAGKFKGGLADAGEATTKLHTAAHLLLAALRQVLGDHVFQRGSNITAERLRLDFSHPEKMTAEQLKKVEDLVNQAIAENYEVICEELSLEEAKKRGAMGVFESKYGEKVKVYSACHLKADQQPDIEGAFSQEICGGPHVKNTGTLGHFKIQKEEASSAGVRRIKAILE